MGIRLIVEVLDHAPADLTPAERLVLLVLAESANDTTRTGWPGMDAIVRRTGLRADSVTKVLRRLAARGIEVRVPITTATGRVLFAHHGHQTTYRLPKLHRSPDHDPGLKPGPPSPLAGEDRTTVRESPDYGPLKPGPPSGPSPQEPSKNPQKQQRPRAPQRAGAQQLPPHIAIIVDATGATPDEAQAVAQLINDEKTPTNLNGFLRRLAADGELADWLDRVRADGDRDRRAEFMNHIRAQPRCEHGQPGGHIPSPGGWVACPQERRRLTNTTPDRKPADAARAAFEEMTRLTAAGREDDAALVLAELPDDILDQVDRLEAAAKASRYLPPKSNGRRPGGRQPLRDPHPAKHDKPL